MNCPHCGSNQLCIELTDIVCVRCGWRKVTTRLATDKAFSGRQLK